MRDMIVSLLLLVVLTYVFLLRPLRQAEARRREAQQAVQVGDEVEMQGGLLGTVKEVHKGILILEIAPGVEVRVARRAVESVRRLEEARRVSGG